MADKVIKLTFITDQSSHEWHRMRLISLALDHSRTDCLRHLALQLNSYLNLAIAYPLWKPQCCLYGEVNWPAHLSYHEQ